MWEKHKDKDHQCTRGAITGLGGAGDPRGGPNLILTEGTHGRPRVWARRVAEFAADDEDLMWRKEGTAGGAEKVAMGVAPGPCDIKDGANRVGEKGVNDGIGDQGPGSLVERDRNG